MITYTGRFDEDAMVKMAREYIAAYSARNNIDEIKIPFKKKASDKVRYVEFALLAGNWVYVGIS